MKFRKIHRKFRAGAKGKNEMLSDFGGGGLASALDVQSIFIKENWICAMTRNHAEIFFQQPESNKQNNVCDNKTDWKCMKPFSSEKRKIPKHLKN